MKPTCEKIRERLAEEGPQALRADAVAQRHLEECDACFEVLDGLSGLDSALAALPGVDAPDGVVESVLASVRGPAKAVTGDRGSSVLRAGPPQRLLVWAAAAASIAMVAALSVPSLLRSRTAASLASSKLKAPESAETDKEKERLSALGYLGPDASDPQNLNGATSSISDASPRSGSDQDGQMQDNLEQPVVQQRHATRAGDGGERADNRQVGAEELTQESEIDAAKQSKKTDSALEALREARDEPHPNEGTPRSDKQAVLESRVAGVKGKDDQPVRTGEVLGFGDATGREVDGAKKEVLALRVGGQIKEPRLLHSVEPVLPAVARQAHVQGTVVLEVEIDTTGKVRVARVLSSVPLLDDAAIQAVKQRVYEPTLLDGVPVPVLLTLTVNFRLADASPGPTSDSTEPAERFLAERGRTDVATQAAAGYWANTYVPGDPALRILQARLQTWDRSALSAQTGLPLELHDAAEPGAEPFDAPVRSGLAVFLRGDRRAAAGPQRMMLEVGLQASLRRGAARPPLTLALVLDLRSGVSPETAGDLRALVLAFAAARTVGDRFSLTVAGRPGAVGPDAFRHGQLAVALDAMLSAAPTPQDLAQAVAAAYRQVGCEDASAAIGSREVVLVAPQSLAGALDALADLAHQGAVAGIPLSVLGVGSATSLPELDRLALAGQGSRRQLTSRADAPQLVDAELAAAGDVVARAVRLRIRLAPGVRLVEVLGSRRLDETQAQRVRAAERSIDLGLSRQLGIAADRGDDEDGIQIVLPRVQAGDAHVVLLDVIVPGPGPVADVCVRFKDLVALGNGTARAALVLPKGEPGPLDRTVLRDMLALRLAETLTRAAACLDAGDAPRARRLVEDARVLRSGLVAAVPGLGSDPALRRDIALLGEYAQLLGNVVARPHFAFIADSLRYAGRLRQRARPAVS